MNEKVTSKKSQKKVHASIQRGECDREMLAPLKWTFFSSSGCHPSPSDRDNGTGWPRGSHEIKPERSPVVTSSSAAFKLEAAATARSPGAVCKRETVGAHEPKQEKLSSDAGENVFPQTFFYASLYCLSICKILFSSSVRFPASFSPFLILPPFSFFQVPPVLTLLGSQPPPPP